MILSSISPKSNSRLISICSKNKISKVKQMLFGVKSKFEQVINQNEEILQIFNFQGLNNVSMNKVSLYFIIEEFNIAFITLCKMILLLVNLCI